mmetsp:Transcript_11778/g.23354  ORF Transcript_11778/g.23354 Transcript_11778/m.23354 type:complete len:115 (-) Transcript_11778:109-453(-)
MPMEGNQLETVVSDGTTKLDSGNKAPPPCSSATSIPPWSDLQQMKQEANEVAMSSSFDGHNETMTNTNNTVLPVVFFENLFGANVRHQSEAIADIGDVNVAPSTTAMATKRDKD